MTNKAIYSNSNEICSLIESACGRRVTPLTDLEEIDQVGELLLFDVLFYQRPDRAWTVEELLEKRPEWESQIVPLLKAREYVYLFSIEWCVLFYDKELDKILFQPLSYPPDVLEDHCLLSTELLTFMMRQEIRRLIAPATYACSMGLTLSDKLKRPVELGTPQMYRDVCDWMVNLVIQLDRELGQWKDRFFFDALEADESTLCSECKESMRVAFYAGKDQSQALKWRPHGNDCSRKQCKYFKSDVFDDDWSYDAMDAD